MRISDWSSDVCSSDLLCAQEIADESPLCLVHGDAHLGNSYRRPDGDRIWFDWQIVRKGRPWRDYSYFVIGSITIEDRRRAERDLLRHYCNELSRHGVEIRFEDRKSTRLNSSH